MMTIPIELIVIVAGLIGIIFGAMFGELKRYEEILKAKDQRKDGPQ